MNKNQDWLSKSIDEQNSVTSLEKLIGVVQPLFADVEDLSDDLT